LMGYGRQRALRRRSRHSNDYTGEYSMFKSMGAIAKEPSAKAYNMLINLRS